MNKMVFQAMGAFLLSFAAVVVVGGAATVVRYPAHSVKEVVPLVLVSVLLVLLGVGLYRVRIWAALVFSVLTVCLAVSAIKDAIHSVPWSWSGIGYWFALLLITPTILTVKYRRTFSKVGGWPTR